MVQFIEWNPTWLSCRNVYKVPFSWAHGGATNQLNLSLFYATQEPTSHLSQKFLRNRRNKVSLSHTHTHTHFLLSFSFSLFFTNPLLLCLCSSCLFVKNHLFYLSSHLSCSSFFPLSLPIFTFFLHLNSKVSLKLEWTKNCFNSCVFNYSK